MNTHSEFTFNGQKAGEKVIEVIPNHPYVIYPAGFRTILAYCAAVAIFLFLSKFWVAGAVLMALASLYFINAFYSYKESLFIITNLRLFNVEQKGFFKRKITEVDLTKIQDISSETHGMVRTMLKYGDLIIRTAGASQGTEMIVKNIGNPYYVQQRVTNLEIERNQ